MNPSDRPLSPLPALGLEGYAEELRVPAGTTARLMLGGPPGPVTARLEHLVHGDTNPLGPGFKSVEPEWGGGARTLQLSRQVIDFGSYVEIPDAPVLSPPDSFTFALWIWPTLLHGAWQVLAVKGIPDDFGYALYCGGHRLVTGAISQDGKRVEWCAGTEYLPVRSWQFVALVYSADAGTLKVWQWQDRGERDASGSHAHPVSGDVHARVLTPGALHRSTAPLLLGAAQGGPDGRHWAHFNGKLARPVLLGSALVAEDLLALARGVDPGELGPVLGSWDLSRAVDGAEVMDVSGLGNHGTCVNAPGRAVTGPAWGGGASSLFTDRPDEYDALHLHEDDLDDARWASSLEVDVPNDARSGIYALDVRSERDRIYVPFVVTTPAPSGDVLYLAPTLTWQAYGTNQFPWSHGEDGVLDRGLSLYNTHSDGSMVTYVTRRKPTRAWTPSETSRLWGAHLVTSSLYLVDWLEQLGFSYDVSTDEALHGEGADLLSRYRCVIIGSHAEYWTAEMLTGLREYLCEGGRVLYLCGNGIYWVASIDPTRQFLMEVRKSGEGDYDDRWIIPEPGQAQHSTTLSVGGLWARRGHPPRALVGVEHGANVMEDAAGRWGFRRLPASFDPRFAFVFEGVDGDVIGDFGLNLGSAAGYEMDRVQEWQWAADGELVVLARATHERFVPPRRLPVAPAADLSLLVLPRGGAVFAAGSVTWTGSLSWHGYKNSVSRITENVLRRFLERPAGASIA